MGWTGNHSRRERASTPSTSCSNSWMIGVSCRRALGSTLTASLRRSCARPPARRWSATLTNGHSHGEKAGHTDGASRVRTLRELERPAGAIETGATTAYDPIIGAAAVRSTYNVDGTGMTVAVIDTGVDYNNPALGGGFGPNDKVIAGYDFADNTANPMATARSTARPSPA